jgi:hypothetical protein
LRNERGADGDNRYCRGFRQILDRDDVVVGVGVPGLAKNGESGGKDNRLAAGLDGGGLEHVGNDYARAAGQLPMFQVMEPLVTVAACLAAGNKRRRVEARPAGNCLVKNYLCGAARPVVDHCCDVSAVVARNHRAWRHGCGNSQIRRRADRDGRSWPNC